MTYVSVPRAVCDADTLLFYTPYPNSGHTAPRLTAARSPQRDSTLPPPQDRHDSLPSRLPQHSLKH